MSGYEDTRLKIISTLMGRPNGTQILPEKHQDYALSLLEYLRSVELNSYSTFIGNADSETTPIQPDDSFVTYLSGIDEKSEIEFKYFIGQDGKPIYIKTSEKVAGVMILIWNKKFWSGEFIETSFTKIIEGENIIFLAPAEYEDYLGI